MAMSKSDRESLVFKLGTVFKPATPINREDLFSGRKRQIRDVVDAINQSGQHVVLYGERGVGKTSLANMLFPNLRTHSGCPVLTPLVNCTSHDTFSAIWKRVFDEFRIVAESREVELTEDVANLLSDYTAQFADEVTPDVVRRILMELAKDALVVVIIDEIDTLQSKETAQTLADTIKFLSDRNTMATVVLIGVSDDVESLIENHRSIERCLAQIHMPRMSKQEIRDLITNCLNLVRMTIDETALFELSRLARGLPHYAHLLGLHAGRKAADGGSLNVEVAHVEDAIPAAIDKVQASIQSLYRRATTSARPEARYREVLLACAVAKTDEFGFFSPVDVREPLSRIEKKQCGIESFARHLHAFTEDERGPVLKLEALSKARPRFRFDNALIQPYVILKGIAEGLITEEDLRQPQSDQESADGWLF